MKGSPFPIQRTHNFPSPNQSAPQHCSPRQSRRTNLPCPASQPCSASYLLTYLPTYLSSACESADSFVDLPTHGLPTYLAVYVPTVYPRTYGRLTYGDTTTDVRSPSQQNGRQDIHLLGRERALYEEGSLHRGPR